MMQSNRRKRRRWQSEGENSACGRRETRESSSAADSCKNHLARALKASLLEGEQGSASGAAAAGCVCLLLLPRTASRWLPPGDTGGGGDRLPALLHVLRLPALLEFGAAGGSMPWRMRWEREIGTRQTNKQKARINHPPA
jgi:hypothetical protein